MDHRKFLCIVDFGLEVNNIIDSGLSESINKYGKIYILSRKKIKQNRTKFKNILINDSLLQTQKVSSIEKFLVQSCFSKQRINLSPIFTTLVRHNTIWFDYIIGNKLVYNISIMLASFIIRNKAFNEKFAEILKKRLITDIIIQGTYSYANIVFATTAKRLEYRGQVIAIVFK